MKTVVNSSLIPKSIDSPLDYRSRILSETGKEEDIINKILELGNPFEGQIVYDKSFDKYYVVTSIIMDEELNVNITIRPFIKNINIATKDDIIKLF